MDHSYVNYKNDMMLIATFEQVLCVNSTDQREAAIASNRKVICCSLVLFIFCKSFEAMDTWMSQCLYLNSMHPGTVCKK